MQPTPYPHVNDLLDELLSRIRGVLGDRLVGLYLYGSLVTGDFDDDVSDIDLLAATARDVDAEDLEALKKMHHAFVRDHEGWDDRIEVAYLSVAALRTFKTRTSPIAIISPGEPLHLTQAGRDWLMNWYLVREAETTLVGPPPTELIPPVSKAEFVDAVREHAAWGGWPDRMRDRGSQSYAILTMCRALYAHRIGEHVSKQHAAAWAQQEFPAWAPLIRDALLWRAAKRNEGDHRATLPDAVRFVNLVRDQIAGT
jgi:predicted nucleotidyltransferase